MFFTNYTPYSITFYERLSKSNYDSVFTLLVKYKIKAVEGLGTI